MGSGNFNLFHVDGLCSEGGNNDVRTERYCKEHEDEHIKVSY